MQADHQNDSKEFVFKSTLKFISTRMDNHFRVKSLKKYDFLSLTNLLVFIKMEDGCVFPAILKLVHVLSCEIEVGDELDVLNHLSMYKAILVSYVEII